MGTATGETAAPAKVIPKATNSVVFRIAVFYVGSLILLALLLPYTAYNQGTSPFVTFFSSIGVPAERLCTKIHRQDDQTWCAVCM